MVFATVRVRFPGKKRVRGCQLIYCGVLKVSADEYI